MMYAAAWLCAMVNATPADATQSTFLLQPPGTRIDFTVFAFGILSLPANYQDFRGSLTLDPARPDFCRFDLVVQVASLKMRMASRTQRALSPEFLDAAHYPTLSYTGACHSAARAEGTLVLHGVSQPVPLRVQRHGNQVLASGSLQRERFGVNGLPGVVGKTIRISLTTTLPASVAAP